MDAIVNEAVKIGAPLTEATVGRLSEHVIGSGKATRSSDVIVSNATDKVLHLSSSKCEWGGFARNMFPEPVIPSNKSSVFAIESNGYMAGVSCDIDYKSSDGNSWISLFICNPYIGSNEIRSKSSSDLTIIETLGRGHNNQVRFYVKNTEMNSSSNSTTGHVSVSELDVVQK